jgi:hypothetical protein
MPDDFDRLIQLVPPPQTPADAGTPELWSQVEEKLGTALPQDYKRLVNTYGVGWFANYFCIYSPFSEKMPLSQPVLWEWIGKVGDYPEFHHPFPVFPLQGGLLPLGTSNNADPLCWLTEGPPDEWVIISLDNHYSPAFRKIPTSLCGLLAGWFSGEITGDWYPKDVKPTIKRVFTSAY